MDVKIRIEPRDDAPCWACVRMMSQSIRANKAANETYISKEIKKNIWRKISQRCMMKSLIASKHFNIQCSTGIVALMEPSREGNAYSEISKAYRIMLHAM